MLLYLLVLLLSRCESTTHFYTINSIKIFFENETFETSGKSLQEGYVTDLYVMVRD